MSPRLGPLSRWSLALAATALAVAVFAWEVRTLGNIRIDDAYITFSFSKNLALGHGPVYSHGLRVEGYSNFLWMLLVAVPLWFKPSLDPYLVARVLTVPFAALLGWATHALIRFQSRGRPLPSALGWAGVLLLAFDADLVVAAICGLETLPYLALLVAGFALYLKGRAGSARARALTVPCLVGVALMRIDGFAPLAFILAWELVSAYRERRLRFGTLVRWAGPGLAVYVVWFAWRYAYYGLPLPTTYYAKQLIPKVLPDRGFNYARDFWASTGLFAVIPFALLALGGRARRPALLLAAFVAAHTAYVIRVGGDWMPFWRFLVPVVPLAVVLLAWGAAQAGRLASRVHRAGWVVVAAATLATTVWVGRRLDGHSAETKVEREKLDTIAVLQPVIEGNFLPASRLLGLVVESGQRLVSDYAGVMAYFTDAAVLDMWGLANKEIALRGTTEGVNPIWGRTCPPCYAGMDPDFFHVQSMQAPGTYRDHRAVVGAVWQSGTIGKYVDFKQFVAGRVTDLKAGRAMFFLQRRRPGSSFQARRLAPDVVVEYPFAPEKSLIR